MNERELIWAEFTDLKRDEVYAFARDIAGIAGLSKTLKDAITDEVSDWLDEQTADEGWDKLIRFVARRGALGKQHVYLYDVPEDLSDEWADAGDVETLLAANGHDGVLGTDEVVAAPDELTIASVTHEDGRLRITAAGRRLVTRRDSATEALLSPQIGTGKVVRVTETVPVRVWVLFEWDTTASTAELRIGELNGDSDYDETIDELKSEVSWLPLDQFEHIDLASVVRNLHVQAEKEELEGKIGETTLQGADYITKTLRSENRSRKARQPMLDGDAAIVDAMRTFRDNGDPYRGNCHWRKKGDGGVKSAAVLKTPLHTDIAVTKNRVKVMRPVTEHELRFLFGRLRALA